MIEEKYIKKFYNILCEHYDDKTTFYQKATYYLKGVIKNGGKINELIYCNYQNKKHFNQDEATFHHLFSSYRCFINIDLFKFMEEKGMVVIGSKFLYPFHYDTEILSHIDKHYIQTPLNQKEKEEFYDAFMCAVNFGVIEALPFYFESKGKDVFFEDENKLIGDLSYSLYWHSFDDNNEETVAFVMNQYYKQKNKNLLPQLIESYLDIAKDEKSAIDDYNKEVISKISVLVEKDIFNQNITNLSNKKQKLKV